MFDDPEALFSAPIEPAETVPDRVRLRGPGMSRNTGQAMTVINKLQHRNHMRTFICVREKK
jgi:hypothetical protein